MLIDKLALPSLPLSINLTLLPTNTSFISPITVTNSSFTRDVMDNYVSLASRMGIEPTDPTSSPQEVGSSHFSIMPSRKIKE
jgi:hypothetical protein